jgi:hypothetical protein
MYRDGTAMLIQGRDRDREGHSAAELLIKKTLLNKVINRQKYLIII